MSRWILPLLVFAGACSARSDLALPTGEGGRSPSTGEGGATTVSVGNGGDPSVSVSGSATTVSVGAGGDGGGPVGICGDGAIDPSEDCDDGNLISGDGCSSSCTFEVGALCGNGILEATEACDLGGSNVDRPALSYRQGGAWIPMRPLDATGSATTFYAYSSASSHTGFEKVRASRVYFYRNRNNAVLSLIVHHGIDLDATGITQPQSRVLMSFSGLPTQTFVSLSDDGAEFFKDSTTTAVADWAFQQNSDGGVLAAFPFPGDWIANATPDFVNNVDEWLLYEGPAPSGEVALDEAQTLELRALPTPSACRTDCTVPGCGDGVLDGGETCDDGNTVGGDGCSADCLALL